MKNKLLLSASFVALVGLFDSAHTMTNNFEKQQIAFSHALFNGLYDAIEIFLKDEEFMSKIDTKELWLDIISLEYMDNRKEVLENLKKNEVIKEILGI